MHVFQPITLPWWLRHRVLLATWNQWDCWYRYVQTVIVHYIIPILFFVKRGLDWLRPRTSGGGLACNTSCYSRDLVLTDFTLLFGETFSSPLPCSENKAIFSFSQPESLSTKTFYATSIDSLISIIIILSHFYISVPYVSSIAVILGVVLTFRLSSSSSPHHCYHLHRHHYWNTVHWLLLHHRHWDHYRTY